VQKGVPLRATRTCDHLVAQGGMRLGTSFGRSPVPLVWSMLTPIRSLLETVLGVWSTPSNPMDEGIRRHLHVSGGSLSPLPGTAVKMMMPFICSCRNNK
jgi:hypothetical protein